MSHSQALQLFNKKLQDVSKGDGAADLVRALDCIPLAVTQAAAHIIRRQPPMSARDFLRRFEESRERENLLRSHYGDLRRDTRASNAVFVTWKMSFDRIRETRPSAADLLSLMSCFNSQGIPEWVLRRRKPAVTTGRAHAPVYAQADSPLNSDHTDREFENDIAILQDYYLVKTLQGDSLVNKAVTVTFEMHPLVHLCTKLWLSSHQVRWQDEFLTLMSKEFPPGKFENWAKCQQLLPHLDNMRSYKPASRDLLESWAGLLVNMITYMSAKGNYNAMHITAKQAYLTCEESLGSDDHNTILTKYTMADSLRLKAEYEEAKKMSRQVLEARKKMFGENDVRTAASRNLFALVLIGRGEYKEAEEELRRVLETYQARMGLQYTNTLMAQSNLGLVLYQRGKYNEAEKELRKVLEVREATVGLQHPDTILTLYNLATVLTYRSSYEEALKLYRYVLEWRKNRFGPQHPKTLDSMSALGYVLNRMGSHEDADSMHRQALEGAETALGPHHLNSWVYLSNLGFSLMHQSRYEEAEDALKRAFNGEAAVGLRHRGICETSRWLGKLYLDTGRHEMALNYCQIAYVGHERVLGAEDADTIACRELYEEAVRKTQGGDDELGG